MKIVQWSLLAVILFLLQTQAVVFQNYINAAVVLAYVFGLKGLRKPQFHEVYSVQTEVGAMCFGAAVGLLDDIIKGGIIGTGVLTKGLVGFLTPVIFTDVVFRWTPQFGMLSLMLFTAGDVLLAASVRALFGDVIIDYDIVLRYAFIQALIAAPFGFFIKPRILN